MILIDSVLKKEQKTFLENVNTLSKKKSYADLLMMTEKFLLMRKPQTKKIPIKYQTRSLFREKREQNM